MKVTALLNFTIVIFVFTTVYAGESNITKQQTKTSTSSSSTLSNGAHPLPFRAGDALEIVPFPDTTVFPSGFYPIDGEGFVDFPIIGYIKVTDKSCEELQKLLAEKYVEFMRYPHMRIRPMIRVALNGGFYRPGLYWIDPHATLWETVQIAGGPQRADGFKKLKWERNRTEIDKNLVPLLQDGKSLYQIGFKTGDQLTVTQKQQSTGWDVFKTEILPLFTFTISTAVSIISVYSSIQMYDYYRSNSLNSSNP